MVTWEVTHIWFYKLYELFRKIIPDSYHEGIPNTLLVVFPWLIE